MTTIMERFLENPLIVARAEFKNSDLLWSGIFQSKQLEEMYHHFGMDLFIGHEPMIRGETVRVTEWDRTPVISHPRWKGLTI